METEIFRKDLQTIVDKKAYRKKVLLHLAQSPLTIFPVVIGLTSLAGIWAFSLPISMAFFVALSSTALGLGVFLSRIIMGDSSAHQSALQELIEEAQEKHWLKLKNLHKRLASDDDERDESMLRDLINISHKISSDDRFRGNLGSAINYEILEKVDLLYSGCIQSLERNLELIERISKSGSIARREEFSTEREKILNEIQVSICSLEKLLLESGNAYASKSSAVDLARLRTELDESIQVAKRVEQRLESWNRDGLDSEIE